MDPYIDEKLILVTSAVLNELFGDVLSIDCIREAYGPTINEGLCYEYCIQATFTGSFEANFFLGLDGYTKILLLPYLSIKYKDIAIHKKDLWINEALFSEFGQMFSNMLYDDIKDFSEELQQHPVKVCSRKLVSLPTESFRKYIIIFFLKDESKHLYLGRAYCLIAVNK